MRRREVLSLIAGAAAGWPLNARAQNERVRRIGVLVSGAEADPEMQARLVAIRQGLSRFGWTGGHNVQIDYRYASADAERTLKFAKDLVALTPDVIIAFGSSNALALKNATDRIPIVFIGIPDPIGVGLIEGLARPGANLTGTLLNEPSVVGKWLGMLKEFAPKLERAAVLHNPKTGPYRSVYAAPAEAVAGRLGIKLVPIEIIDASDIERGIAGFAREPNGGLLVPPDFTSALHRNRVISLAAQHRLPAVYQARFWVAAGGLMSYGSDRIVDHRQAAYYVNQILRGARPADLPVQAPTKYETAINLKTANALGLAVPPGLLVAADEVIE